MSFCAFCANAQELNCFVTVNADRVNQVDKRLIDDMKQSITEFLNMRRWTPDQFQVNERIICNLLITIRDMPRQNYFEATAQIQVARPIFGTGYQSISFNFVDTDWQFEYNEGQPLDFNENSFFSNFTSLLGFYANIIVGIDYETFSKNGGQPYFLKAQQIAQVAQQSGNKGWQTFESVKNRSWLIENLMNQQFMPFREGLYSYFRLGLDKYAEDPIEARKNCLDLLRKIQEVRKVKPISIMIDSFFDVKSEEIINIFMKATAQEKQESYNILVKVDPTRADKYETLLR